MSKKSISKRKIQDYVLIFRRDQAKKRSDEFETGQLINADVEADVIEGLYSKGLSHVSGTGLASQVEINKIQFAVSSGEQADFDSIQKQGSRKQVDPQASLSCELTGADPEGAVMPPCPSLASRQAAAEMVEVYEKCILKDKTFAELNEGGADADADRAVSNLNSFGADFKGPKTSGSVTRKLLFRGLGPKENVGPYVSQFLLHPVVFGAHTITQQYLQKTGEYGISAANWLSIQNGNVPVAQTTGSNRYCATPRDLGSIVHVDFVYQQFLYAALIMLDKGLARHGAYPTLAKEDRFVTNAGGPDIGCAVAEVARHALKAAWAQKWRNHLRLRPEAMAGRTVKVQDGLLPAGTVHADLIGSSTIDAVKAYNVSSGGDNKAWLPLLFAEGSPLHPAYPAGHAAISGACVTLLKLFFADGPWSNTGLTLSESTDGATLSAYSGADAGDCTIHGELNKLASNIAIGRNIAGVHYRSDGDEGVKLGEKIAIQYWKDLVSMQNESIGTVTLVKFDGTEIQIRRQ